MYGNSSHVIQRSPDCLSDPDLSFENVARVRRAIDLLGHKGPVAVAGDCTKVKQRLQYSRKYGGNVLGSVLSLEQTSVATVSEIDTLVGKINKDNKLATQTRAILIKVRHDYGSRSPCCLTYFMSRSPYPMCPPSLSLYF